MTKPLKLADENEELKTHEGREQKWREGAYKGRKART